MSSEQMLNTGGVETSNSVITHVVRIHRCLEKEITQCAVPASRTTRRLSHRQWGGSSPLQPLNQKVWTHFSYHMTWCQLDGWLSWHPAS